MWIGCFDNVVVLSWFTGERMIESRKLPFLLFKFDVTVVAVSQLVF